MERSRAVLIPLICVLFSRMSGEEVEMRVRPGDDVTLYSDCVWKFGFNIVWFRNCSHDHQPPLIMSATTHSHHARIYNDLRQNPLPRYFFVWNSFSKTYHLLVKNVSESDLCLYYCALQERLLDVMLRKMFFSMETEPLDSLCLTQLFLVLIAPRPPLSPPPASDCSVCWKLLVSACLVCVLLSSTCVCCICRYTTKGRKKHGEVEAERTVNQKSSKSNKVRRDGVCYASLDLPSRRQKPLKEERVENFEFSTYSEVKTDRL
ncbi:hypothetical protein SRHO_G00248290 [Serrasalmus rhombeus]